ncbi:two-component system, OmpR family, sensor histidine kinase MprB [Microlunatus sagamiharensis]|uniref:histidine kinase n=1 Tax=Microlunatus sagamiharensis TaxID=546874 RepID=A0A1H2N9R3_9ACTN|nr:HAMP domain-containing sensor histidine kinase [Microlunatus sagamiharensis]SDV01998.1 two-component system, OmpR family, sensor histidine kinase MprB [Microlunatus sagamiharensis]
MEGLWSYLRRKPLQRRVTALTVLFVLLAIIVSNLAGYVALRQTLYRASQSIALTVADDLLPEVTASMQGPGVLSPDVRQAGGVIVEVVDAQGRVVRVPGETAELVLDPQDLASAAPDGPRTRRTGVDTQGTPYVVAAVPVGTTGYALVVARPLGPVLGILATERLIVLLVVLGGTLGAAVAGIFVARAALRPVRELTAAVQTVTDTKNFQPITIKYAFGDLSVLAASFNQLLRTVTRMRERQGRLVADAGHELRTPLTSLTTNVDLLSSDLQKGHLSEAQRSQILGDVRAQLGELTDLVGDLVQLSRDDAAGAFVPLDLRDVVQAAVERVRRRAADRTFDVVLDEFHVVGDAAGLERTVTNLLDNAVKWSPAGSTIRVRLEGNRLRVADSGPGIAEADLPYVFDRFFRGSSARRTPGTGLGLSIVAKTVEDHGGTVTAGRSDDGGAEFTVQLPGVTHVDAIPAVLVPAAVG